MATVILTQDRDEIGRAIIEALDNLPLDRLVRGRSVNVGESDLSRMTFPAMSLDDAIGTFTEIVDGKRLTFEHA